MHQLPITNAETS